MKLWLISPESKETVGIEIPEQCTLENLKQAILQILSSSISDRKDELQESSSEEDSLRSIGFTSGDIVFFTFNSSEFSPRGGRLTQSSPGPLLDQDSSSSQQQVEGQQIQGTDGDLKEPRLEDFEPVFTGPESFDAEATTSGLIDEGEKILESDCEEINAEDEPIKAVEKKCWKPIFLRIMMKQELGHDCNGHKLLVTAVHTVLLESGFVLIDPISGSEISCMHMPGDWPSPSFLISLWYTLPELLPRGGELSTKTEVVLLKFQCLGHFVNVYGRLSCSEGPSVYRASLDERKFGPSLVWIWLDSVASHSVDEHKENTASQVFEFWKTVKDALALPLLIDLCAKTGLPRPSSFMQLPADLKLKIFEALPSEDIASVQCVCTELRYLASSSELRKMKVDQQLSLGEEEAVPRKKMMVLSRLDHRLPRRIVGIPQRYIFIAQLRLRGRGVLHLSSL